jgi:hypothetical protein
MKDDCGQALIETIVALLTVIGMVVCLLGFTKWMTVRQKMLIAVRHGALLYSSGRMTEEEVRTRLLRFLTNGSPALKQERLQIQIGRRRTFLDTLLQLDIVKVRYTSESSWYALTHLNPTVEEKCIIRHAAPYGIAWQPLYGPPVSWWQGPTVPD